MDCYDNIQDLFTNKNIFLEINGSNFILIFNDHSFDFKFVFDNYILLESNTNSQTNFEVDVIKGTMNKKKITNLNIYFNELLSVITSLKSYCIGCYEKLSINSSVYSTCGNIICSYKLEEYILDNDITDFIKGNGEIFKLLLKTTLYTIKSNKCLEMLDPFPNYFLKQEYKTQLIKEKRGSLAKLQLNHTDFTEYSKAKDIEKIITILDSLNINQIRLDIIDKYPSDQLMSQILGKDTYLLLRFIIKSCCMDLVKELKIENLTIYKISHPFYIEKEFNTKLEFDTHCYLFHGSSIENWYSILRNGIKVLSNTSMQKNGAAYGVGIYVSDSYSFAHGYSSKYNNNEQIVGVYEVLGEKSKYYKTSNIYVIPSHEQCLLRYLIVGNPKTVQQTKFDNKLITQDTVKIFNESLYITDYFDKKIVGIKKNEITKMKTVGYKKLMGEFKKIMSNTVYKIELVNGNIFKWNATWLNVTIQIKFPELYPFDPPFIFILTPQFNNNSSNITSSGAICCDYLTKSNWLPATNIENIIIQIFGLIIEPNLLNINLENKIINYNEYDAIISYEKLAKGNGWL